MYFKVALYFVLAFIFSGCSNFFSLNPPKPVKEKNVTQEFNTTIIPIEENNITEKNRYNLKPEPFSLKSNEQDPELLGPQTTLDRDLLKKEIENKEIGIKNSKDINITKEIKTQKKTISKNENKEIEKKALTTQDSKKEETKI